MSHKATKPLKIDIYLRDGRFVSYDGIIMFDGILYHAWFLKFAPHVIRGEGIENYDGNIGLPLLQLPGNRWAASKGIYEELSQSVEHYNKRPDFLAADKQGFLQQDSGIISDSVGIYRAYRNPVIVRTITDGKMTFYCRGNKDKIEDLLSYIPAAGKKPVMGWGIIDKFEISEVEEDYSLFHPKYGLMRPLPIDETKPEVITDNYPVMKYGVKPPYWKSCNMRLCYVPIR